MREPPLKHLKTFQIAAHRGSFRAAAAELCLTASAVSHQIRALEAQLGLPLFERGPRALALTPAGTHFLAHVDALFARLETATRQLRERFMRAVVRLRVPPFFATELLLPRLAAFSAAQPEVDIQISTEAQPRALHDAQADVSVLVGAGDWPALQCVPLFEQAFVPACSPGLQERLQLGSLAELASQSLLVHGERADLWDRWAASCGIDHFAPKQLIRLDSMAAVVQAAEQGVGVALVSAPLAAARFAAGTLRRLFATELATGERYCIVARPEDAARPAVGRLIDWLRQEFSEPALR